MFCKNCGQEIESGAQFCGSCGTPCKSSTTGIKLAAAQPIAQKNTSGPKNSEKHFEFATSYSTFYIKGKLDVYPDHIEADIPNTLFNFIPLGSESRTVDVNQITSPKSNFKVSGGALVLGILFTLFSLTFVSGTSYNLFFYACFLFCMIIGIAMIISAFQISLEISLTSGDKISIPLIIFEKDKADLMKDAISAVCKTRTYDTNTRIHAENSTTKIVDAINNINTAPAKTPSAQTATIPKQEVAADVQVCATCGESLPANAKFCLECGSKVEASVKKSSEPKQIVCASCGAELVAEAKFCPECGTKRETAGE